MREKIGMFLKHLLSNLKILVYKLIGISDLEITGTNALRH